MAEIDMASLHPKSPIPAYLRQELVDPQYDSYASSSHKKVEWQCKKDSRHRWFASIASRVRLGSGCPYCSGRIPFPGENDLATTHPEVAARLVDPSEGMKVSAGSGKKLNFVCDRDPSHVYSSSVRVQVKAFVNGTSGCPICSKHEMRQIPYHGLFVDEYPDLAAEAVDIHDLDGLRSGTATSVLWRCDKHRIPYTYSMPVKKRVLGQGCPVCGHRVVVPGINDLATTDPELAGELVNEDDGHRFSRGSEQKVEWMCKRGHVWKAGIYSRITGNGCPICASLVKSAKEEALADFVRLLVGDDVEILRNDTSVLGNRQELDIVIPSKHIALEFNGMYWHSVEAGKNRSYHHDKMVAAKQAGYRVLFIWEDDWDNRQDAVKRMVAAKLGCTSRLSDPIFGMPADCTRVLDARRLDVRPVSLDEAKLFLNKNHIQGFVGSSRRLGLWDGDVLVAVVCATAPNRRGAYGAKAGEWEITRYATCGVVRGGFSRLLAHLERDLEKDGELLTRWVSFSANDISDGGMYARCGFYVDRSVPPEYMYAGRKTGMIRESKRRWQRSRFKRDPRLAWDDSWTEFEAARNNGLLRVYDSGKIRWAKDVNIDGTVSANLSCHSPLVAAKRNVRITDISLDAGDYVRDGLFDLLVERFGEFDIEAVSKSVLYVKSIDTYVAYFPGAIHGWHWLGEVDGEELLPEQRVQMTLDAKFRDEMRTRKENLVVFWDNGLDDACLWLAMGAPVAQDWECSYSWLSARPISPIPLPTRCETSQAFTTTAKHYQHEVIFARELAMWGDDVFLDRRQDKRRLVGAFFANRHHYIGKLPDELTDAEILRGIRIAGYASAYSRYDSAPMLAFLDEHADVRCVIDPCAGWGERMLACASRGISYEGVDANEALRCGYEHMVSELGLVDVTFSVDDGSMYVFGDADAIICCPPYAGVEWYCENGAENLDLLSFDHWWVRTAQNCAASGAKWFCITTNQACRDVFVRGIESAGYILVSSTTIGRSRASHFNRRGGQVTKHEFEEFLVFERN